MQIRHFLLPQRNDDYCCYHLIKASVVMMCTTLGYYAISSVWNVRETESSNGETDKAFIENNIDFSLRLKRGLSSEFLISVNTSILNAGPSIASLTSGNLVITWSGLLPNQIGANSAIFGQIFDSSILPLGPRFNMSNQTSCLLSAISGLTNGDFVIIWVGLVNGVYPGVFGQHFSPLGAKLGAEFQITNTSSRYPPAISGLSNGYVVVWSNETTSGQVYGQLFSFNGTRLGPAFLVSTNPIIGAQPVISTLANGNFVIALNNPTFSMWNVSVYLSSGTLISNENVTSYTGEQLDSFAMTSFTNNNIILLFDNCGDFLRGCGPSMLTPNYFTLSKSILGQRFSMNGIALGNHFTVSPNKTYVDSQFNPAVATLPDDSYVVVWQSYEEDGDGFGIYGQHFAANDTALGPDFLVNSYINSDQAGPAIVSLLDGSVVIVWTSSGEGGAYSNIYAKKVSFTTGINSPPLITVNQPFVLLNSGVISVNFTLLQATDFDNYPSQLLFYVDAVSHGYFRSSLSNITLSQFTQLQINTKQIEFASDGTGYPSYMLHVTDGKTNTSIISSSLFYIGHNLFVVMPGQTITLNADTFNITAPQFNATMLQINVVNAQYGQFQNVSVPGVPLFSFTLAQLNMGNIVYVMSSTQKTPVLALSFVDLSNQYVLRPTIVNITTFLNHPPIVVNPIGVIQENLNQMFVYTIPSNVFSDSDGLPLTLSLQNTNVSVLPSWIQFNILTNTLNGQTPDVDGTFGLRLVAADIYGATAYDDFYIKVGNGSFILNQSSPDNTPLIAGSAVGGAVVLGGVIGLTVWGIKRAKDINTRKRYPLADLIRDILKLKGIDNFDTDKGKRYVATIQKLADEFSTAGISVSEMSHDELKKLAKQIAISARNKITATVFCGYSIMTVEDIDSKTSEIVQDVLKIQGDGNSIKLKNF